jgi:serine/threonine-protein kinase
MFREAAALATYSHPRIPRLVESNAHLYADAQTQLYLVTDFVKGKDLSTRKGKPFSLADALRITDQLSDVVEYCHARGGLHRDIKPENVILRDGQVDAVLIDFGLTFNFLDPDESHTGDWQELGNRFLRLPELSSYSVARHDPRSDISFLAGILYFCLFGKPPALLEDEAGRLPHQRDGISLQAVTSSPPAARLLAAVFDRAFRPRLVDRYPNVREFRIMLQDIDNSRSTTEVEDVARLAEQIKKGFSKEKSERQRLRAETLTRARQWVESVLIEVSNMLESEYVPTSSGDYDPNTDHSYRNMGLHHQFRGYLMRYWLKTTFRFVGSELVVTVADEPTNANEIEILRTGAESPQFEVGNRDRLKSLLLRGISQIREV